MTSVFFLLGFILFLSSLLLVYKSDSRINFIHCLVICYVLELCIGSTSAFVLSLFSVPVNILSVGVIYWGGFILLTLYSIVQKKLQTFYVEVSDFVSMGLLTLCVLFIIYRVFHFSLDLNYFNADPGVHFGYAMDTVNTGKLGRMYFSSLYNALFIQMLQPIFDGVNCYKSFILADSLSNLLSGMVFYVLLSSGFRSRKMKYLCPVITLFYFVGWPVYNYVLGGFVYWGISITLIATGVYFLFLYQKYSRYRKQIALILFLLLFNIATCYMLFIPYVIVLFGACLIFIHLDSIRQMRKSTLLLIVLGFVALGIATFAFAFYNYFHGDFRLLFSALSTDGGIHKCLYKDFIYFTPLIFFSFAIRKHHEQLRLLCLSLVVYLSLVVLTLVLCYTGLVSPYYYYKTYFLLWLLVWLVSAYAVEALLSRKNMWFIGFIVMLGILFIYPFSPLEDITEEKKIATARDSEFPLYSAVASFIKAPKSIGYDEAYWDFIYYVDSLSYDAAMIGNPVDYSHLYWYGPITGNSIILLNADSELADTLQNTNGSNIQAFIIPRDSSLNESQEDILADYTIGFQNEFATVYQLN